MAKQSLDEMIEASEDAIKKGQDLSDIEADHRGKAKDKQKDHKEKVAGIIRDAKFAHKDQIAASAKEESKEAGDEPKAEKVGETAGDTEKTVEKSAKGEISPEGGKAKKPKKGKAKIRSKKYQELKALIEVKEKYDISDALELVKKTSMTKFDGNIEVHIRLAGKMGKPEQVRGLLQYPFSTGRKISVVILDEKIIDEIADSKKVAADIYLVTPVLMPKAAKLAKILGPKGKMPNPKAGTITADPEKTKKDLEGGQTEYKTDAGGNIHQIIGKISGKTGDLAENFKTLLAVLPLDKVQSIHLCATMGPAVKVKK